MTDPAVLRRLVEQWREELHRETNAARYTLLDRCIYQVNAVLAMECGVPRNRNLVARWRDEGGAWTVSEMAGFIEELLAALALSVDSPCLNPDYCGIGDADTICANCQTKEKP